MVCLEVRTQRRDNNHSGSSRDGPSSRVGPDGKSLCALLTVTIPRHPSSAFKVLTTGITGPQYLRRRVAGLPLLLWSWPWGSMGGPIMHACMYAALPSMLGNGGVGGAGSRAGPGVVRKSVTGLTVPTIPIG
jgi:hypothetical protein